MSVFSTGFHKKVKFNEIVEKAKKIAAEMLMKAKGFVKEGEQMIKGGPSWRSVLGGWNSSIHFEKGFELYWFGFIAFLVWIYSFSGLDS